jgi:serine/threonine-protein kinase
MSAPLDCPEIECWQELFDEALPPDQEDRLEQHLESCAACQERLHRAAGGAEALQKVGRQFGDPTATPPDRTLIRVLKRLYEVKSPLGVAPVEPAELYFLSPAERPDLLGTLGEYEVQEVIGQGGMGVVLKAFEPALHRLVAIKVLAPALAGSATARRRFTREAQAAAAVCHDHVVAVHGVSEAGGLPYLVMQYVPGESLQARLDRCGPLELTEVIRIGLQTAQGLAAAHAQGLIHRDIKPANLLLENGLAKVKITDFGLARTADDVGLTRDGVVAGTPEYMAPEQARGEAVDHRADLFSLGSVLYTVCTGRPPFRSSATLAVLRQVSEEAPVPIRERNADVPGWLEALVARLLAKNPADRFQSAAEVAALLEGYLAHLRQPATVAAPEMPGPRPAARTEGSRQPLRRLVPRSPRLLVPLILAVLGLGMGLTWFGLAGADGGGNAPPDDSAAPVRRLRGHTGPVHNVRFTPDGQRLVSGSGWPEADHTVRVWNVASGQELSRVMVPGGVHSLDLTPDGRFALVGLNTGQVLYLDIDSGQVVRTLKVHGAAVGWVALAADGRRAFSTSDEGTARMWSLADGRELARFDVQSKQARGGAVLPDGRLLTGDSAGMLQLWDTATGREVKQVPMGGPWMIDALRLSADGRQVLVSGVAGVRLYDLETGEEVRHFQEEAEEVHQADLSPDGHWLLTGSFSDGKVRLWDFRTGELLRVLGSHNGFVFSVAFTPDGRVAASAGGGEYDGANWTGGTDHDIRVWDLSALRTAPTAVARKSGGRGWLAAATILVLVIALSLLGVWYSVRPGRRAGREPRRPGASAVTTGPDEGQDDQTNLAPAKPAIALTCAGCGKKLKARADLAGKRVKCPQCARGVLVPGGAAPAADGTS